MVRSFVRSFVRLFVGRSECVWVLGVGVGVMVESGEWGEWGEWRVDDGGGSTLARWMVWVLGFGFWVLGFGCGVWCLVFGVVEVSWASGRQGRAFVFLCWFIMVVVSFRLCCCGLCRGRSLGRGLGLLLW